MITTDAEIKVERKISENLFLLSVRLKRYMEWIPGMFLQLSLETKSASEPWLDSRAFSFASWGNENAKILVRREGNFTSELISKSESGFGTSVRYPFGKFLLNSGRDKVLIAGGAGISVFLSYLDYLNANDGLHQNVIIFHSSKRESEGMKRIYWDGIPANVYLNQFITHKAEQNYTGRFSIGDLSKPLNHIYNPEYYICGPSEFNSYWMAILNNLGVIPNVEQWVNQESNR